MKKIFLLALTVFSFSVFAADAPKNLVVNNEIGAISKARVQGEWSPQSAMPHQTDKFSWKLVRQVCGKNVNGNCFVKIFAFPTNADPVVAGVIEINVNTGKLAKIAELHGYRITISDSSLGEATLSQGHA